MQADPDFNPLFATDLFHRPPKLWRKQLMPHPASIRFTHPPTLKLRRTKEVPVVNKPRTACSYFFIQRSSAAFTG